MKRFASIVSGIIGLVLIIVALVSKEKYNMAVSVIGGADGPTSVFVAGKVGKSHWFEMIAGGIFLLCIAILLIRKSKTKKN
ncbi:sodium ion-translocating decarboxylase subunit beta [Anaerosporobacter faecicola]|uniref:sodium ion-translocating decarboxylase subunit beta n=1 Tax=Anaerosporobacter faecicola TaxID=2718714 RepID=UPI00143AB2C8|nr:sodium ion-translocating decarboxylase subunit beta [Anaerosporobacter faecicola]